MHARRERRAILDVLVVGCSVCSVKARDRCRWAGVVLFDVDNGRDAAGEKASKRARSLVARATSLSHFTFLRPTCVQDTKF